MVIQLEWPRTSDKHTREGCRRCMFQLWDIITRIFPKSNPKDVSEQLIPNCDDVHKMPLGSIVQLDKPQLEEVFGFCHASIKAPDNLIRPILPCILFGKLLTTTGY